MTNTKLIYKLRYERITVEGQRLAADAIEELMLENERLRRLLECPYKAGTLARDMMLGDWANMTMDEIAEALHTTYSTVSSLIGKIKRETGHIVQHRDRRKERGEA